MTITVSECPHCGAWRDEQACRADPYINAEPRTYCPVAKSGLGRTAYEHQLQKGAEGGLYVVYGDWSDGGHQPSAGYFLVPGTGFPEPQKVPPRRGEADQFGGPRLYG